MARIETQKLWRAADGAQFDNEAEADAHDEKLRRDLMIGMTAEQFDAALTGADAARGKAIEHFARTIFENRKARGEVKSRKKASPTPTPSPSSSPTPTSPSPSTSSSTPTPTHAESNSSQADA